MAYKNPKKDRPYKREYELQKARGEGPARAERQKARAKMDKNGKDANKNGKADKREGKDVAHKKALSKGGKNKDGVSVQSRKKNRAAGGALSKGPRRAARRATRRNKRS
tara:strand:+ start:1619 stop:1945 length:327 start_codon:yes stop_codon:yes gene_type:complete